MTLVRKTPMRRGGRIKAKKRKPSEFARIYGSKARVEFVKGLPCVACGGTAYCSENHHIEGDGVARKAHYTLIIPLCPGCHLAWHHFGRRYVESHGGFLSDRAAAETERLWQAHLAGGLPERTR